MYKIIKMDDWIQIIKDGEVLYENHYINPEDIFDILEIPYQIIYSH